MVFNSSMLMAGATANASGYTIPYSCRFVSGNSPGLSRAWASGNRTTATLSLWFKIGKIDSTTRELVSLGSTSGTSNDVILCEYVGTSNIFQIYYYNSGVVWQKSFTQVLRDPSAWYHLVVAFDTTNGTAGDRVIPYLNGSRVTALGTSSNPTASANQPFNVSGGSCYIGKEPAAAGYWDGYVSQVQWIDGQALTPSSFGQTNTSGVWVPKAYTGTYGTNGFFLDYGNSSYLGYDVKTSGVTTKFTNSSEWTGDTGDFSSLAQNIVPNLGQTGGIRTNDTFTGDFAVQFQWQGGTNPAYLSVYDTAENATFNSAIVDAGVNSMTNAFQMFFGAGSIVDAKRGVTGTVSAGIFTVAANDWIKLQRSGSTFTCYQNGTLKYTWVATSSATMRVVVSQNSSSMDWRSFTWTAGSTTPANSFYASGLTSGDQFSDTPTLNYPVLNPLNNQNAATITSGNLTYTLPGAGTGYSSVVGTVGVTSGKWYWEVKNTSAIDVIIGIADSSFNNTTATPALSSVPHYGYRKSTGNMSTSGSTDPGVAYGATYTTNDFIGIALDLDSGTKTITFYKNNTTQGAYTISETGKVWFPTSSRYDNNPTGIFNFGASAFNYTPPTGFVALNTSNLPAPAIKDGSAHFQTSLYTGNATIRTISQTGNSTFTPGLLWVKDRDAANPHSLWDAVRGVGAGFLRSHATNAAQVEADAVTAFGSGSFSVGADTGGVGVNQNTKRIVAWQWKAGGAGVSNTSGSITSTVSANTTAGFSVVTYTATGSNATVGHGLGAAPKLIIVKCYSAAGNGWTTYHVGYGATKYTQLQSTAAAAALSAAWQDTEPTSTVFSIGTNASVNNTGQTHVAYCFAEVAGFSAFGATTGNGSTDGPFIYTGFKPAYILIKHIGAVESWIVYDAIRDTYNPMQVRLIPDTTDTEASAGNTVYCDALSNGFKIRSTIANAAAAVHIYAAFASNPFGGSGAAPATAR